MTDTPTPGQICYEVYRRAHFGTRHAVAWGYAMLEPHERDAWEAAAQAVLDAGPICLLCGTRLVLQRCTRFEDPHWPGCLACGGIGYVLDCPGTHTDALIAAYAAREREKTR
jgi:hypothetical protein